MVAGAVLEVVSSGEYRDERLYLLESVKRQEKKLDATLTEVAIVKSENAKFRADLNEAHGRVRGLIKAKDELQKRVLGIEVRAGSIAAGAGIFTAAGIEFIFRYLAK